MKKTKIDEIAANVLFENGKDFLDHSLTLLFDGNKKSIKLSVVNMQMAMELFLKYKLTKNDGFNSICEGELLKLKEPIASMLSGQVKTINYNMCKDRFIKLKSLGAYEKNILDTFQNTRNAIVHLGKEISTSDFEVLAAHLVLKVFRRILEDEAEPWLYRHLNKTNYNQLVRYQPYIDEASSDAKRNGSEVLHCFECSQETFSFVDDSYYCYCCGMIYEAADAPYIKCPFCKRKAMTYDALNAGNDLFKGKCIACQDDTLLALCSSCKMIIYFEVDGADGCEGNWVCPDCI